MYFALRLYLDVVSFDERENMRAYVSWCCEMACGIPLVALMLHQSRITTKTGSFKLKRGVSALDELESHDVVLLLSCLAIFMFNILRLLGGVVVLCRAADLADLKGDQLALASFGVIYAVYELLKSWVMTSFLIIVQRQAIEHPKEAKWTLLCLLYIITVNATQWFAHILETDSWNLLYESFGNYQQGIWLGLV